MHIRWTALCDLFLILIVNSAYDALSRVLLEQAALKLGLGSNNGLRWNVSTKLDDI